MKIISKIFSFLFVMICFAGSSWALELQEVELNGIKYDKADFLTCGAQNIPPAEVEPDAPNAEGALTTYLNAPYQEPLCDKGALSFFLLKFDLSSPVTVGSGKSLTTLVDRSQPLVIDGLKMRRSAKHDDADHTFTIVHNSPAPLIINGLVLENVKEGLRIEKGAGAGKVYIFDSRIDGDGSYAGDCLDIKAAGTVIDHTKVRGCKDGMRIDADNVRIINESESAGNRIGIRLVSNRVNLDIKRTRVFGNNDLSDDNELRDDAYRIENRIENFQDEDPGDFSYYASSDEGPATPVAAGEDGIVRLDGDNNFLVLNDALEAPARIDFYRTRGAYCSEAVLPALNQPCDFLDIFGEQGSSLDISSLAADGGVEELVLPPEYRNVPILFSYKSGLNSSSRFSKPINIGLSGIVAIIQNPLDIPTPGNEGGFAAGDGAGENEDDEVVSGNQISSDEQGDGVIAGGTGMGLASGCGKSGSSLIAVNSTTLFFQMLGFSWVLLVVVLLSSLRVFYRVLDKKNR
jgi:hypothetical protein